MLPFRTPTVVKVLNKLRFIMKWIVHVSTSAVVCYNLQGEKGGEGEGEGGEDYKSSQQFASHMKKGSQAVSTFAKTKTLKEQRQFLPIFAIRQQVRLTVLPAPLSIDFQLIPWGMG